MKVNWSFRGELIWRSVILTKVSNTGVHHKPPSKACFAQTEASPIVSFSIWHCLAELNNPGLAIKKIQSHLIFEFELLLLQSLILFIVCMSTLNYFCYVCSVIWSFSLASSVAESQRRRFIGRSGTVYFSDTNDAGLQAGALRKCQTCLLVCPAALQVVWSQKHVPQKSHGSCSGVLFGHKSDKRELFWSLGKASDGASSYCWPSFDPFKYQQNTCKKMTKTVKHSVISFPNLRNF